MSVAAWIRADIPASAFQARCQRGYFAWLSFRANPIAMIGFSIIAALILMAVAAPVITSGNGVDQNLAQRLKPPGGEHWFGTDQLGRDIYDRIVWGSRITLYIVGLVGVIVVPIVAGLDADLHHAVAAAGRDAGVGAVIAVLVVAIVAALAGLHHAVAAPLRQADRAAPVAVLAAASRNET